MLQGATAAKTQLGMIKSKTIRCSVSQDSSFSTVEICFPNFIVRSIVCSLRLVLKYLTYARMCVCTTLC
jgi:hypothetical protein